MRHRRILAAALLVIVMSSAVSIGQESQYTFVAETFYESYVRARQFDDFVRQNRLRFDQVFNSCLNAIYDKAFPVGAEHAKRCNAIPGAGKAYLDCINKNVEAGLVVWIESVRLVISGQKRWSKTLVGSSVIGAEDLLRTLAPEMAKQIIQAQADVTREMAKNFVCTKQ